jgi:PncC family amidohydrolase
MSLQKKLVEDIFQQCLKKDLHIITMESCTGGLISGAITDIPGSSKIFDKGLITYSNESKVELLGVSKTNIDTFGAVSLEVVTEMATKLIIDTNSQDKVSIATSGVAGPGKSEKKPVGLVWLASYKYNNLIVRKIDFGNISRYKIRKKAVYEALKLLQENLGD